HRGKSGRTKAKGRAPAHQTLPERKAILRFAPDFITVLLAPTRDCYIKPAPEQLLETQRRNLCDKPRRFQHRVGMRTDEREPTFLFGHVANGNLILPRSLDDPGRIR